MEKIHLTHYIMQFLVSRVRKIIILLIAFMQIVFTGKSQEAASLQISQNADSIIFIFNLTGSLTQKFDIRLAFSTDDGKTFTFADSTLTGDLKDVTPGPNKKIIWIVPSTHKNISKNQSAFRIMTRISIPENHFLGNSGIFYDERDGEKYKWVKIGKQYWMAENLRAMIYNNGVQIPNVKPSSVWKKLNTGAYCWYNNNVTNKEILGALYNWYAVNSGKICPRGWHVPSEEDWSVLESYLGGSRIAGGKMKSLKGFGRPNEAADNSSGFSAVAGGYCNSSGAFRFDIYEGYWWSAIDESFDYAWFRYLSFEVAGIEKGKMGKKSGLSIRCIKD